MSCFSITIYGCENDEQIAFLNLSPQFGITPFITSENISEENIKLSSGSKCVSVGHKKRVSRNTIAALKNLGVKYINTRSIGVNHIDMQAAKEMGIVVENIMYSASSVADYTLMLILMVVRNMKNTMKSIEKNNFCLNDKRGKELQDLTVGVLGAGHIGQAVIDRLHSFGCKILVHDPSKNNFKGYVSFQELLETSDILTIHVPLSTETYHLIDYQEFESMKTGAYLINTARGGIINTVALINALDSGLLGGAALDVLEGEEGVFYEDYTHKEIPNSFLSHLERMPNVILTPHTAYYTEQTLYDTVEQTLTNCKKLKGTNTMEKIKVAILFGGVSEEHDVSIKSAKEVASNINREKYEPLYIGITRFGEWKLCENPSSDWEKNASHSVIISSNREMPGLLVIHDNTYQIQAVDVIFPVIHGKMGEDGTIQGLLELSGIPYVGCGIQASTICMDKSLTYLSVQNGGFKTPEFNVLNKNDILHGDDLTYPVFVKPARSGSSFGVTKAHCAGELYDAIQTARQYDNKVLVEQAIVGMEVGCAVLGNKSDLIVGEVDQIKISHGFFRIHQEDTPENGSQNSTFIVPADIPQEKRVEIQQIARAIYQTIGCSGLARVDMFLQEDGQIVLNEINTMPGFTSYSRYPRMMNAANISFAELIDRCIMLALERN